MDEIVKPSSPTNDHDLLIRIDSVIGSFLKRYDRDSINITNSMNELKNVTAASTANHEGRLNTIERIVDHVNPIDTYKEFQDYKKTVDDMASERKRDLKWINWLAGFAGGAISFFLTQLPGVLKTWGILK